jgi:hypothetical protein
MEEDPDEETADPGAAIITAVLDGIPGAYERAQLGQRQVDEGKSIPLDEL